MKKLINSPENVVVEALRGMEDAYPDLIRVHYDPNLYCPRRRANQRQSRAGIGRWVGT